MSALTAGAPTCCPTSTAKAAPKPPITSANNANPNTAANPDETESDKYAQRRLKKDPERVTIEPVLKLCPQPRSEIVTLSPFC
jgi:hypothetical protein